MVPVHMVAIFPGVHGRNGGGHEGCDAHCLLLVLEELPPPLLPIIYGGDVLVLALGVVPPLRRADEGRVRKVYETFSFETQLHSCSETAFSS